MATAIPALLTATQISSSSRAGKYLFFQLGREEYGIDVLKVQEIIGFKEATALPHAPSFVKGVFNLRGKVIPLVDLRLRFGMAETAYHERTCVIVVRVEHGGVAIPMGVIVDAMTEVRNLAESEIEDTPDFGAGDTGYLLGIAKTNQGMKILLAIEGVLDFNTLQALTLPGSTTALSH
jgi:purine-binding chemotaxis protein CheW